MDQCQSLLSLLIGLIYRILYKGAQLDNYCHSVSTHGVKHGV